MPSATEHPGPESPRARFGPPVALACAVLALIAALAAIGESGALAAAAAFTAIANLVQGGLYALAYVLAAIGIGRPLAALCARAAPSRLWVQAALGLGLMLWLSHLLGVLGLLSGDGVLPRVVAWGTVGLGLVLLVDQMIRGDLAPERWPAVPWPAVLLALPVAVTLVAAASPPGWLWDSEFGGYDAMSYHLQLPREWAAGVALAPAEHNVYSFLPGYVEAAYLHLGQMMLGGDDVTTRMLGGEGLWVYACQMLHALLGILGSLLCGRCAWAAAMGAGATTAAARTIGIAVALVALGTGWTMVCASLAYNEMGVLVCGAGALLLCLERWSAGDSERAAPAWLSAAGVGALVGAASSCKPTALLLLGPAAGLLMLAALPRRAWAAAIGAGAAAGLIVLAPWLIRNALAAENPVFPFAADLLGTGHWTAEQTARYARAHAFDGPLIERFALMFSARGWLHQHWGATPWLCLGASLIALTRGPRAPGRALAIGTVIGLAAWMFGTHVQSRFLLPLLAPMCALLGLGAGALAASAGPRGARPLGAAITALALVPAILGAAGFLRQRGGEPNAMLIGGVGMFTGMSRAEQLLDLPARERAAFLHQSAGPFEVINMLIRPGVLGPETLAAAMSGGSIPSAEAVGSVYLLGDATPLYYLGATGGTDAGVIYHTTWDRSPLGDAIRARPDDPAAWSAALRARGITFVLVNLDELARLIAKDRNFDPDVTIDRVLAWLSDPRARCTQVWSWNAPGDDRPGGQWLVHLGAADPEAAP